MKCLTVGCEKEAKTRGLCGTCRSTAFLMMKKGEVTEDFLVKHRLILPAKCGRALISKFRQAVDLAIADDGRGANE